MPNVFFKLIALLLLTFTTSIFAETITDTPAITHVIYITLDGVRWQDIYNDHSNLPIFWKKYSKMTELYGEPGSKQTMETASIPISLPSYQSQMTGTVTSCRENDCGSLHVDTFPEMLIKKAGFKKADVASISSWEVTDNAFEQHLGTAFSNHGTRPMHDPETFEIDAEMKAMNIAQSAAYPGDDTRPDKYTLEQALHYFKKFQPKFLWISFGDADDFAHDSKKNKYRQTLAFYDGAVDKIMAMVKTLNLQRETMIIITTDHGRGNGKNWIDHDETLPESKQSWAFVINGKLSGGIKNGEITRFSTLSIRPTVEKVFGIN
jgi:hypothetical protein